MPCSARFSLRLPFSPRSESHVASWEMEKERMWLSFDQVWNRRNDCKEKGEGMKKRLRGNRTVAESQGWPTRPKHLTPHRWTKISSPFRNHLRGSAICAFVTRPGENVHVCVWGGRLGNSCHIFPFSFKTKMQHTPKCARAHLLFVDMLSQAVDYSQYQHREHNKTENNTKKQLHQKFLYFSRPLSWTDATTTTKNLNLKPQCNHLERIYKWFKEKL